MFQIIEPNLLMTLPRVCSFESRRQSEMSGLIERHGGVPTVAASMQEVPLADNAEALAFGESLLNGDLDFILFLTGVGARALLDVLLLEQSPEVLRDAFNQCEIMVRGPKPVPVLREFGIKIDLKAPEPNTWREVVGELERANVPLEGCRFAIQEYGAPSVELTAELKRRGAVVTPVSVYQWALPDDTAPLEAAIRSTINGEFDILLCTSAQQINNILDVASRLGVAEEWKAAARNCVMGSIGPTASERLREHGLPVSLEPSHPKMAHLVRESIEFFSRRASQAG